MVHLKQLVRPQQLWLDVPLIQGGSVSALVKLDNLGLLHVFRPSMTNDGIMDLKQLRSGCRTNYRSDLDPE